LAVVQGLTLVNLFSSTSALPVGYFGCIG
jgi:hypothetical protein